jgi:hypothetical protein
MRNQARNRTAYRVINALALLSVAVLILLLADPAAAYQEGSEQARRLAQAADSTSPEMKAFRDGREALADERWARAEERFGDFVTDYPKSKNVDAALYWLAYALQRQEKFARADKVLGRLIKEFPASNWAADAQALRAELAPHLGNSQLLADESGQSENEEAKLVALRALFRSNQGQALARASEVFRPDSGVGKSFKESVIMLLGRNTGAGTLPLLSDIARREPDAALRSAAISWLGASGDESVLGTLRELALESDDAEIAQAALSAILKQGSQRAIQLVGEVAAGARSVVVRGRAASVFGAGVDLSAEKMKGVWLLVRDRNQLRVIPAGHAIKLIGAGLLTFKEDGRLIEIPRRLRLTINGQPVFRENEVRVGETADVLGGALVNRERIVRERDVVRAITEDGRTMWELTLGLPEGELSLDRGDWLTINGEFTFNTDETKTFLLYPKPGGGLRLRR